MGLELIDTAVRRRGRGIYFRTIWGWLLFIAAVIVWFFGSDERRHGDDEEMAARRRRADNISRIAAASLFVLAVIVDLIFYEKY